MDAAAAGSPSPRSRWALLALATLVGFLVYPTYPNYDSYYSLLWGRELLHGIKPSFDGYRTPTEHPLAVLFGAALSLLGNRGDRVMVFATLVSLRGCSPPGSTGSRGASFGWVVGLVAAALRVHALRLPVPRRPRLHRHPVPRRSWSGPRRWSPSAAAAGRPCSCCWRSPG